jgi:hypothetical protein
MTRRVLSLSLAFVRNLYRTLFGVLPPGLTLLVYRLSFTYRHQGDPAYFTALGGIGLAFVGVVTALLVADRANRAAMYPFIARLPRRAEFLFAVVVATLFITVAMAGLYTSLVLSFHVALTPLELLLIFPRWLSIFILSATLGLLMSRLASRHNSHVIVFVVLGGMALSREQIRYLVNGQSSWFVDSVEFVVRPITDALTINLQSSAVLPALAVTLLYAAVLLASAVWLFQRKDLLWME